MICEIALPFLGMLIELMHMLSNPSQPQIINEQRITKNSNCIIQFYAIFLNIILMQKYVILLQKLDCFRDSCWYNCREYIQLS